jgi:hypothetical protein
VKILWLKVKLQGSSVQATERWSLVTVITVWGQMDTSFLCYLYFQENVWNQNWWMAHHLDQSACDKHPSGWIQNENFTQWFNNFINRTKPTKWDPVILIPDEHYSQARNLEVITLAREKHVDII